MGPGLRGAPSLLPSAVADAAGPAADTVQSVMVTAWNIGIAGAGILGGLLLSGLGASSLAGATFALLVVAFTFTITARRHAVPARGAATQRPWGVLTDRLITTSAPRRAAERGPGQRGPRLSWHA